MLPEIDPKTVVAAAMAANAFLTAPLALLIKRDFRRLGRASWAAAVWSGIAMHGHALATFLIAWLDRGSLYAPAAWSAAAGGALAGNPLMAAGLSRIGEAAQRIWTGDGDRAVAHATSGPCLQQNLVAVLEGN